MSTAKKLYLVHCGYYDATVLDAVYEFHVNLIVAADSFDDARAQAKLDPTFSVKRMHVDGVQEIEAVNGYSVKLEFDAALAGATRITSSRHRDLAPKTAPAHT